MGKEEEKKTGQFSSLVDLGYLFHLMWNSDSVLKPIIDL